MIINNKEILLISAPVLKAKTYINRNVEDSMIFPALKVAQDIYLKEVIGEPLLRKLCTLVEGNNVSTHYETLLKEYIQDYLCYSAQAEIQTPLFAKIRAQGVVNTNGTDYQQISKSDVDYNRKYYINLAQQIGLNLVKYLDENYTNYPEWTSTPTRECNNFTTNICL